ncbi:MAG: hypothetical protein IPJ32_09355 [Sphingobacteriaceae bacterium]|nr:hypothetical protein [Sphingobacteriaceae bacterium]
MRNRNRGPFRLTNYVVSLNKKFPNVKFIADFRDLWTEDSEITFFSVMSEKRKRIEKRIEKETILKSNKVIATMDSIADYFSALSIQNKFTTISNGYDPDDFNSLNIEKDNSGKIIFVYAGTLYINLQYIITPLFKAIGELKRNEPELYNKIEFRFIGKFPDEYKKYITENNISEAIKILNFLPLKETLTKIKQANYGVLILNDVYNFNLSTKFFEYISQKKKVVVVSSEGSASKFIQENKLGVWLNPQTSYTDLIKLIKDTENETLKQWDSTFDIEQFSVNNLTDKLINVIEEPFTKGESLYTRNLLFTFDYELFLGKRSGTVENCILKPTDKILELFSKYKVTKAIFFVDTTYLKN